MPKSAKPNSPACARNEAISESAAGAERIGGVPVEFTLWIVLQLEINLPDEAATQAVARRLARSPLLANACFTLSGDLGSGKTTFVRHLLRALGVQGRIKSPTYALMETYDLTLTDGSAAPGFHFDLYRIQSLAEWETSGFRDVFADSGLKVVEWPEKVMDLMLNQPSPTVFSTDVAIELVANVNDESARTIKLQALSDRGQAMLEDMQ
jgi:tRNA threonylcarbamoyladenosine biosynthesis protein TsaE